MNLNRSAIAVPALSIFIVLAMQGAAFAANTYPSGVLASPHNLSAGGVTGKNYGFTEVRVCIYCHTPHNAQAAANGVAPLWNRALSSQYYSMYESPTFTANVNPPTSNQPTGASRACLGCHDGTIALNSYGGAMLGGSNYNTTLQKLKPGPANLGTNLQGDHPISFPYTEDLAVRAQLVPPAALPSVVKLDSNGNLQCTACHDPHNDVNGNFLVMDNSPAGSPLCSSCHTPTGWNSSSPHFGVIGGTSGCMNCHTTHTPPPAPQYLLNAPLDQVCFYIIGCHDGLPPPPITPPNHAGAEQAQPSSRIASLVGSILAMINKNSVLANQPLSGGGPGSNLKSLFKSKIYRHPIGREKGAHDHNETYPLKQAHVVCADCHNSHAAGGRVAMVSGLKSSLRQVKGVSQDTLGTVIATAEYEICYKCHAGPRASYFIGLNKPNRVLAEPDQMKRFSPSNPSFHPVAADRKTAGNSLFPQYRATMIRIDCSDCHNSDESKKAGGIGPNGPHASRFEHILIARYEMPVKGTSGRLQQCNGYRSDYALCFICHMDFYVMVSGSSFANGLVNEHAKHVADRCIPCFACHDPHGTPAQDGASAASNAHLINFDKGYAASPSQPAPRYMTLAPGSGSCTVACHIGGAHSYAR
jgi:predicted CXXCH cytochrome family protein